MKLTSTIANVNINKHNIINYFVALLIFASFTSCSEKNSDEIPSYLKIDTASIISTGLQGTSSHKITDVWVYSGNEFIGAYELPAKFPILKKGVTGLRFYAGIKMNGINETRIPNDFFEAIDVNMRLQQDSVSVIKHLKFAYNENVIFAWTENFEQFNLSLDSTSRSEINFNRVNLPELASAFPFELNEFAAKVVIDNDTSLFECQSHDAFKLPNNGKTAFLELNYKSNNIFTIGIIAVGNISKQHPILVVNPSETWNKLYVNLTSALSAYQDYSSFRIYITATKVNKEAPAEIHFDNLKLIHFPK